MSHLLYTLSSLNNPGWLYVNFIYYHLYIWLGARTTVRAPSLFFDLFTVYVSTSNSLERNNLSLIYNLSLSYYWSISHIQFSLSRSKERSYYLLYIILSLNYFLYTIPHTDLSLLYVFIYKLFQRREHIISNMQSRGARIYPSPHLFLLHITLSISYLIFQEWYDLISYVYKYLLVYVSSLIYNSI